MTRSACEPCSVCRRSPAFYHDGLKLLVCGACCDVADDNEAARQQRGEEPRWWIADVLPW
jgi:hypothetical protein